MTRFHRWKWSILFVAIILAVGAIFLSERSGLIPEVFTFADIGEDCGVAGDEDNDLVADCEDDECDGMVGPDSYNCEYGAEITCNDNYDNDADGLVDCLDNNCNGQGGSGGTCEFGTESICDDNFDNDGNGAADCADVESPYCPGDPNCQSAYELCDNESDDDGDELEDCADDDCDGEFVNINGNSGFCEFSGEITCDDGFDNDRNGYHDCADIACDDYSYFVDGGWGCEPSGEVTCDDGFDNDSDGAVDCSDNTNCSSTSYCSGGSSQPSVTIYTYPVTPPIKPIVPLSWYDALIFPFPLKRPVLPTLTTTTTTTGESETDTDGSISAQAASLENVKNLSEGAESYFVKSLQEYLNRKGFTVSESGPGSKGQETEYFGPKTKAALARFQAAFGISPASGFYGPITRAFVSRYP